MAKKRTTKPDAIPKLIKKLDALFSRFVRLSARDRHGYVKCYTCQYKGEVKQLQAGHYVPRQHKATRWMPCNVKPQCYACNVRYGGRPQEFRERLLDEYGEEEVLALEAKRHDSSSLDRDELKEQIAYYKQKVEELECE